MIASVISNLCHIGMAPLPGAFVMARHFAFVLPWTYEAARGEPCSGARPEAGMANATGCDRRSAASRRLHHRLAADEACELAQPHEHALPGKLLEAVIEAQQQSAALDHHRRLRQHAGGRGGNEVGDAQRGAENAGAVEHAGRDEFAQAGREFLVNEADMAEEYSERNKGAARMIDGDEGSIGDDVERLLAAIVGVCPPADVGEKTRHMTQPPLLRGLV